MPTPMPRFVTQVSLVELINLYHLAPAAGKHTRHDRMLWASAWFAKDHPLVSSTAAYKDLSAALEDGR